MSRPFLVFQIAVLGWLSTGWPARAQPVAGPMVPVPAPSLLASLVRVTGALALVFALFLAAIWLFRNWQRLTLQKGKAPKLHVLEVRSLGPRHALYVVGYEQQRFLLSSAPTGVAMLTTLPAAESIVADAPTPLAPNFTEFLLKAVARK